MLPEYVIRCGEAPRWGSLSQGCEICLRRWGAHPNVFAYIEEAEQRLRTNFSPRFLDLFDLAVFVYSADQAVSRGGTADRDFGVRWRRVFHFHVPVRDPDWWNASAVVKALTDALSFLSEDSYHFRFLALTEETTQERYIRFRADGFGCQADEILLFSGGLDSLAGAARRLLREGRRPMLLNHRSNPKMVPQVVHLVQELSQRSGTPVTFLPVRAHKAQGLTKDTHQRARSFLYLSLAAALADAAGLSTLSVFENGVTSLNLPPATQVVGARASRTTHPLALFRMQQFLSLVAGRPFRIERPFDNLTKADVIRDLVTSGAADLILHTRSCAHPRQASHTHPHCGVCSQCIDRRFGVLSAGQAEHDPAESYAVDLLCGQRDPGKDQLLLAAYAETASQIASMDAMAFFKQYGEVTRAALGWPGEEATQAQRLFRLVQRHSTQVAQVLDTAVATHARAVRRRELPDASLLAMVCSSDMADVLPPSSPEPAVLEEHLFRSSGSQVLVRFPGGQSFCLRDSHGARYLRLLLQRPGQSIPVRQMVALCGGGRTAQADSAHGPTRQDPSFSNGARQYQELLQDLQEARRDGNALEIQELEQKLAQLADQHGPASTGLGGQPGREPKSAHEKQRKAVQAAIRRVCRAIRPHHRALADHLDRFVICGDSPCYNPNPLVRWEA